MFSTLLPTEISSLAMHLSGGYAPLGVGLLGLMWLSAGMITWMAVRHYWEDAYMIALEHPSLKPSAGPATYTEYKEAA